MLIDLRAAAEPCLALPVNHLTFPNVFPPRHLVLVLVVMAAAADAFSQLCNGWFDHEQVQNGDRNKYISVGRHVDNIATYLPSQSRPIVKRASHFGL